MKKINGYELKDDLPYKIKDFVGTLLFAQYPTTIVFSDNEGNPIIKEWADCSDDNKIDRFYYYKTSKESLKRFIDGDISHLDLINSSTEPHVIFQDLEDEKILSTFLVSLSLIPFNYKPSREFTFNHRDSSDIQEISEYFGLKMFEAISPAIEIIKDISQKNRSEAIYIRLHKGRGVGYGTIRTEILGRTLLNFDKFYKSVALDQILGNSRSDVSLEAVKNKKYLDRAETEVFGDRIAASYGFLLKPIRSQFDMFDNKTEPEKIAIRAFGLITNSDELEKLKEEYIKHSVFTINSYKQVLEGVYKAHLNVDFSWFSPFNNNAISDNIDYSRANKMLNNINNLATTSSTEFDIEGKFRAVNCDTGHFNFTALNDEQYYGYFDKPLRESLVNINFKDLYMISISRKLTEELDKKETRPSDTIVACYIEDKTKGK